MKMVYYTLIFFISSLCLMPTYSTEQPLPKGLMLNLDFQNIQSGIIPSKTLYPLYVPLGDLSLISIHNRNVLGMSDGQFLDIPHCSLLNPDGNEWIITIRIYAQTNGIVISQGNTEKGYTIYLKDGAVQVAVRTGHSTVILQESPSRGITHCLKTWVTIELKIRPESATLSLNRSRVALINLQEPLSGKNYRIRIGEQQELPSSLGHHATVSSSGFTGAISSLKIMRQ